METTTVVTPEAPQAPEKKRKLPVPRLPKSKKGRKWLRRGLIAAAVLLAVYWFFLRSSGGGGAGLTGQYMPDTVQRRDLTASVSGTGTVTPIESYYLKTLVTGEVLEAPFEVGDRVEKGQLLYRLDAKDAEMSIAQAELALRQAQKSYDDLAANLTVRAGGAGVVQEVLVQRGDLVGPGTPIAEVADTSTLHVTLPFHSADHCRHHGDPVRHGGIRFLRRAGGGGRRAGTPGEDPGEQPGGADRRQFRHRPGGGRRLRRERQL